MKKKRILAVCISLLLCLATASPAFAQTITVDEGKDGVYSGDILMTQNTRTNFDYLTYSSEGNPDTDFNNNWEATGIPGAEGITEKAEEAGKQADEPTAAILESGQELVEPKNDRTVENTGKAYEVGDEIELTSTSYNGYKGEEHKFTAKCVATTENCTVWIDVDNKANGGLADEATVTAFADQIQDLYPVITEAFGDSTRIDVDGDGKVAFVFYPLFEFTIGGFFAPNDLEDSPNNIDMLNINSRASDDKGESFGENLVLGIMVHEWQHLINNAQTGGFMFGLDFDTQYDTRDAVWLDETFAQNSVYLCGASGTIPAVQMPKYNAYIEENDGSTTVPFAFSGVYIPRTGNLSGGVYVNWYLFGRYLSSQTKDYSGGGDAIFKEIFNVIREDAKNPETGETVKNLGMCNNQSLTEALTQIGYMGTGENAKVKDLNELLSNYNMAAFFRQDSGLYSLGTQEEIGKVDLSNISRPEIKTAEESPQKLPGGSTATFTKIENGSITVDKTAAGEHIRHLGITINYDGVTAEGYSPVDGAMTVDKGTPVTLSTTDTGVTLRYTTDGTDPTAETGMVYEEPITVDQDMTIKAITADAYGVSDVAAFSYKVKTEAPAGSGEGTITDKNAEGENPSGSGKNAGTGIAGTQTQTILAAAALLLLATGGCVLIRKRVKK